MVLLEEEMRRVIEFCYWKANWWNQQARRRIDVQHASGDFTISSELEEGLCAYAAEQAAMETAMALLFESKWTAVRAAARAEVEGLSEPSSMSASIPSAVVRVNLEIDDGEYVEDEFEHDN